MELRKNEKLNKSMLVELIEIMEKVGLKEFYIKNESLEIRGDFSNKIKYKEIISDETLVINNAEKEKCKKITIKSKYVAKI